MENGFKNRWKIKHSLRLGSINPLSPPCIPPKFVLHGLSSKSKFLAVMGVTGLIVDDLGPIGYAVLIRIEKDLDVSGAGNSKLPVI